MKSRRNILIGTLGISILIAIANNFLNQETYWYLIKLYGKVSNYINVNPDKTVFNDRVSTSDYKPKYIAHRGYSSKAPENTMEAFKLASENGFYGIEADIRETKDKHFVVMHDETVDRTTDGIGLVKEFTLAEMRSLKVDFGANVNKYSNLKVPTLEEYLLVCKENELVPVIEIKEISNPYLFINILKKYNMYDKSIIISFDKKMLELIRNIDENIKIQALLEINDDNIKYCKENKFYIDTPYKAINKRLINKAHDQGIEVNTWVVDDEIVRDTLQSYNIDYITTNKFTSK